MWFDFVELLTRRGGLKKHGLKSMLETKLWENDLFLVMSLSYILKIYTSVCVLLSTESVFSLFSVFVQGKGPVNKSMAVVTCVE